MARRSPVRWFNDFAARPPARWQQALLVLLAVYLPWSTWQERGATSAIITLAVFTPLFLAGAFCHARMVAWSARRPALDAALFVPIMFACLTGLTDLSLGVCAVIALVAGALLVLLGRRRVARTRPRTSGYRPSYGQSEDPQA